MRVVWWDNTWDGDMIITLIRKGVEDVYDVWMVDYQSAFGS